jgi:hypothetical protein
VASGSGVVGAAVVVGQAEGHREGRRHQLMKEPQHRESNAHARAYRTWQWGRRVRPRNAQSAQHTWRALRVRQRRASMDTGSRRGHSTSTQTTLPDWTPPRRRGHGAGRNHAGSVAPCANAPDRVHRRHRAQNASKLTRHGMSCLSPSGRQMSYVVQIPT